MRDQDYWERWLRQRSEAQAEVRATVKEWYREAGVEKGERRAFKAALKSVWPDGVPGKRGKKPPRRGRGRRLPAGAPHGGPGGEREGGAVRGRTVEGRMRFTREGRPLVIPDDPDASPVRVPGTALAGAWPKDRVVVRIERGRGGAPAHGRIERILTRGIRAFVGRYSPGGERNFVRFRDRDADLLLEVDIPEGPAPEAGDLVLAEVAEYPSARGEGRARVVRRLGKDHTMETLFLAVTSAMDLPVTFPDPVAEEARRVPRAVHLSEREGGLFHGEESLHRVDQRDLPYVTIDGEDARDFDDAVCLEKEGGGYRLYVAIADVSHYVAPWSAIDREAYIRGTSVYFPDRCIPMLPPELSEGACSLKAEVNRLTVTVEVPIRQGGEAGPPRFYPSVIRSRARLTYDEVHDVLAGDGPGPRGRAASGGKLAPGIGRMLHHMATAAGWLTLARSARGALDFDLPEAKIAVEGGMPVSVRAAQRRESHRLIEEFMLLANTAVAEYLSKRGDPFLFRIHEEPAEDRVEEFETAAGRLLRRSRPTDRRDVTSRLQAWAALARGGKYERPVHMMLLRSLMI
ncbi:MAG TPA: RNB domain-containing ribonuclease, partial [Candidatus Deferrimicrobiaceae bacterium]